jgi:hypothetical protein
MAAADFDGDGDLDLVVGNARGASDVVLLNGGDSHFNAVPLGDSADESRAVAVGDLDGDGLIDVVFANAQQATAYRNSGAGTFVAATPIGTTDARDVVVANLYGDAAPEIVFANANADAVVYLRSGASVELAATIATGPATSVAAADFDNDGDLDLVFGRSGTNGQVFRNDSGSSLALATGGEVASRAAVDLLPGDFDADGDMDIVTINAAGGHQLHLNDGAFTPHAERFVLAGARSGALGKISVDDREDVVVVTSSGVGIFFSDGAGSFGAGDTDPPTLTLNGTPMIEFTAGFAFQDPGATAMDATDGDLSGNVVIENPVNPAVIGTYTVVYKVVDSSGNPATVTRTVEVNAQSGGGGGGGGALGGEILLLTLAAALRVVRARRSERAGRSAQCVNAYTAKFTPRLMARFAASWGYW